MSFTPPHSWAALSESDAWWRLQWAQSRSTVELAARLELPLEDVHARLHRAGIDQLRGRPPEGQRVLLELPPRRESRWVVRLTPASELENPINIELIAYTRREACHAARQFAVREQLLTAIASATVIRRERLRGDNTDPGTHPSPDTDPERTRAGRAHSVRASHL